MYRTGSVQLRIAGLQAIEWRDRRMHNVDLSDIVSIWLIMCIICVHERLECKTESNYEFKKMFSE